MVPSMLKVALCSLLSYGFAKGQLTDSSSTNPADGVVTPVISTAATTEMFTTTIGGVATTYRAQFTMPPNVDRGQPVLPNIRDPQAVDPQSVCPGYTASNVVQNQYGFSATLSLAGPACNVYGTDIDTLILTVQYQNADRLSVNIVPAYVDVDDSNYTQYILPEAWVARGDLDDNADIGRTSDLDFDWSNDPTFSFTVSRKSNGDVLFSSEGSVLVFENQFIELFSALPEDYNLYGLGERIHSLRLGNNFTATIYAADVGDPIDYNLYGSHPVYLDTRYFEVDPTTGEATYVSGDQTDVTADYTSYSHGVYLRNAHGQEILLREPGITWRTIGGSIDLYFFDGPSQHEVFRQYQDVIGYPAMQQYWGLGFHQCRWGYKNLSEMADVVNTFRDFNIPLETIWLDIDYMNQYRDFTNDNVTFPLEQTRAFFDRLHADNQHFVPIVDAAIYIPNPNNASDAYPTYNRGNATDSFLMNPDGSQYIGAVWPGYTVFPDWLSPGADEWWSDESVIWHETGFQYDGMWIDMNEVASFCVGSCGTGNVSMNPVHVPFSLPGEPGNLVLDYPEAFNITNATEAAAVSALRSSLSAAASATATGASSSSSTSYLRTTPTPGVRNVNWPPYAINHVQGDLAVHAVSPNATHHDVYRTQEYDVHNLFGHQILLATYQALLNIFPGKRPFIIGRSTFPGSGTVSGHWGGDNASRWAYMLFSIPQALSFSIFGIPMFGVDACGFNGNTDEELCNRWMQLAAFFPFYRNHNVLAANPQEPYRWASVAEASRVAMNIRYQLLPYMYTLFHLAHTTGSTVLRAMAWEFPNEPWLADAYLQMMVGPSILVTPVLAPLATTVNGVFPGAGRGEVWYDWYTHEAVDAAAGQNMTISAPLGHIPVYIRGGSVLPLQQPGYTTAESRRNPWSVLATLSLEGTATGQLYLDDGESLVQEATRFVEFTIADNTLTASATGTFQDTNALSNITILGLSCAPNWGSVTLNGVPLASGCVAYNGTSHAMYITGLESATSSGAWSGDWVLQW